MKAYKETNIKYFKTIFEQSVAGEYEVELSAGDYIVEIYGAGGGAGRSAWEAAGCLGGGGSGAGFKGNIRIKMSTTFSIVVGKGGAGKGAYNAASYTGENGGNSSFGSIITCGGGIGGRGYSTIASYGGDGGVLTINDTDEIIIETEKAINGQANVYARGSTGSYKDCSGGLSVQDNTHYGAGAGGWSVKEDLVLLNGLDGYCKILGSATVEDYEIKEENITYKLPREIDTKYFKTIFEQSVAGEYEVTLDEGDYLVQLVGAGGGAARARANTDAWYLASATGGSGSYFQGIVHLSGITKLTIGAGGTTATSDWNSTATATDGGATSIEGIVSAGGGTGSVYNLASSPRNAGYGGVVSILDNSKVIESIKTSQGKDGTTARNNYVSDHTAFNNLPRTISVYDNTTTGYGAGAGTNAGSTVKEETLAVDGYVKIMQRTTADDSTTSETIYTYYGIGD